MQYADIVDFSVALFVLLGRLMDNGRSAPMAPSAHQDGPAEGARLGLRCINENLDGSYQ